MKGQEIELRTIVQNLSDTQEQTVTLRLWVQHADGSRAVTADGVKNSGGAALYRSRLERKVQVLAQGRTGIHRQRL